MITHTMTPTEMFNSILSDKKELRYWIDKNKPKAEKKFSKQIKFPKFEIVEYEHQKSKNNYLLLFYVQKGNISVKEKVLLVFCDDKDKYFIDLCPFYDVYEISVGSPISFFYTSHFFNRYRERVLKNENLTMTEVIGCYFSGLTNLNLLDINDNIIKDYKEKYGELSFAVLTNEGLCLGERGIYTTMSHCANSNVNEVDVNIFKTFIPNYMLSNEQEKALIEEEFKYIDRYVKKVLFS